MVSLARSRTPSTKSSTPEPSGDKVSQRVGHMTYHVTSQDLYGVNEKITSINSVLDKPQEHA